MNKRLLAILVALTIAIFPTLAFADNGKDKSGKESSIKSVQAKDDDDDVDDDDVNVDDDHEEDEDKEKWKAIKNKIESDKGKTEPDKGKTESGKGKIESIKDDVKDLKDNHEDIEEIKEWEALKNKIEVDKDYIESLKDELEDLIDDLEDQYEEAKENGNEILAESLLKDIESAKKQKEDYKSQMKEKIENMHEVMKQRYTEEEWAELEAVAEELRNNLDVTVLPVENVLFSGGDIKFDTPPVIKYGRTLIPIRSISEALGAKVTWNDDDQTSIIEYGDTSIKFDIENGIVYLNDKEANIDVPAEIINGRIVVPLRFVVENMNLDVEWDEEAQTISISK